MLRNWIHLDWWREKKRSSSDLFVHVPILDYRQLVWFSSEEWPLRSFMGSIQITMTVCNLYSKGNNINKYVHVSFISCISWSSTSFSFFVFMRQHSIYCLLLIYQDGNRWIPGSSKKSWGNWIIAAKTRRFRKDQYGSWIQIGYG